MHNLTFDKSFFFRLNWGDSSTIGALGFVPFFMNRYYYAFGPYKCDYTSLWFHTSVLSEKICSLVPYATLNIP